MEDLQTATPSAGEAGSGGGGSFVGELLSADSSLDETYDSPAPEAASSTAQSDASPAVTPNDGDTPAGEGEQSAEGQPEATADEGDIIAQLAAEFGMDPNLPNQRKALEAIAAARGTANGQQAGGEDGESADGLTDFEKSLLAEEAAPADANVQPGNEGEPPQPGNFKDVGEAWKGPTDAYKALSEAYSPDNDGNVDYGKVNDIETAIFARRFQHFGMQMIPQVVENFVKTNFGDLYEHLQQNKQANEYRKNYSAVVSGLKAQKGLEDIEGLMKPADDKQFTFRGNKVDNSPYNRILAKNPELLNIRVPHKDPAKAQQLTIAAQMRAVHRLWKQSQGSLPAGQVASVVKAGAKAQERTNTQRTLQAINAGPSAAAAGSGPGANSFVSSLNRTSAGELTLDDI